MLPPLDPVDRSVTASPTGARRFACAVALLAGAAWLAPPASAHDLRVPVGADRVQITTGPDPAQNQFQLEILDEEAILIGPDPRIDGAGLLVFGNDSTAGAAGSSGFIELSADLWSAETQGPVVTEYRYEDPEGRRGGITFVSLKPRELVIHGMGVNWPWLPTSPQDQIWVHFLIEQEWWCAQFSDETGATKVSNTAGNLDFQNASAPASCPEPLCGNGIRELGEACDDGNLDDEDVCSNDCQTDQCKIPAFDSTFDAIQFVIFDGYDCSNDLCHGAATEGMLDLRAGASYDEIVNVQSQVGLSPSFELMDLVEPGEPVASFLFEKVAAATNGTPTTLAPMPNEGDQALTPQHLEALEKWIRGGAPRAGVVEGTSDLLGTCLPPDTPLKLDPPPAPLPVGQGVQFWSTAWDLPANSEDEICFATYYDFTQTNLVPEAAQLDCQFGGVNNPSGKCFYYNRRILRQDGQSHHSIIHIYNGASGVLDPGTEEDPDARFGPFHYRPNDPADPRTGQPCDPTAVDPALGYNPDCSGQVVTAAACSGYGPTDSFQAPSFAGSQEPFVDNRWAPGVFAVLPMSGVIMWNSHAFNLTELDTTMAQYLDVFFAPPEDQRYFAQGIFDVERIFVQYVPPFQTREYCKTWTLPESTNLFELSSHTHRWGIRFRIWGPPNEPCTPSGGPFGLGGCEGGNCCEPGDPDQLLYISQVYTDPVQLEFDPPMYIDGDESDRTLLYCSVYDNASTSSSPPLKLRSTSPLPPPFDLGGVPVTVGGPCGDAQVECTNPGFEGVKCGGDDANCGGVAGACDACPVRGGFSTEDEMFILLGSFYVPEPGGLALGVAALAGLGLLARRRSRAPRR